MANISNGSELWLLRRILSSDLVVCQGLPLTWSVIRDKALTSHGFSYYLRIFNVYCHLENVRTTRNYSPGDEPCPCLICWLFHIKLLLDIMFNESWTVGTGRGFRDKGVQTALRIFMLEARSKLMRSNGLWAENLKRKLGFLTLSSNSCASLNWWRI